MKLPSVTRATHLLGRHKFAQMGNLPYLLSKLEQPRVRDACLRHWGATETKEHQMVSDACFHKWCELCRNIDRMPTHGMLRIAVGAPAVVPLDNAANEGPHAQAHNFVQHSRRASWPWVASSVRVRQNLTDGRVLAQAVGADLKMLWSRIKNGRRAFGATRRTDAPRASGRLRVPSIMSASKSGRATSSTPLPSEQEPKAPMRKSLFCSGKLQSRNSARGRSPRTRPGGSQNAALGGGPAGFAPQPHR